MKTTEIRKAFLDFFHKKNHKIIPSSALVDPTDATLLFVNAGMVQFKNIFLGRQSCDYSCAVSVQKCIRAGGKHNDLEQVGYTARHHTFFEMLGNFSFGEYFKTEAIKYAWEFLTTVLNLPPEKLWVTVYYEDKEAEEIWLKDIGIDSKRFSRCGAKDNFWSMGDTGPCGPCTEIFYDHGPKIAGGPPGSSTADGDRFVEIWNLVFMQYNRDNEGVLHPLPQPAVDTGMGLERISAVLQGKHNNFEIDVFQHLIKALKHLYPSIDIKNHSVKVIVDHIRAASFLIAEGIYPTNEGRGYVLRRIIRRALRHGHKLRLTLPFFYRLVQPLEEVMGSAYPELTFKKNEIQDILKKEEQQFSQTLDQGLHILEQHIETLTEDIISGTIVFKLYDTYGFPYDLCQEIAQEKGLKVDQAGFELCMQKQRSLSQASTAFKDDYAMTLKVDPTRFDGYKKAVGTAKILAIIHDKIHVDNIKVNQSAVLILNHTPFYPEGGGQAGDTGQISINDNVFMVSDTKKIADSIFHIGQVVKGSFSVGAKVTAKIDNKRRQAIRLNHTATHLLHSALKKILGPSVEQKGSLVEANYARLDFSYNKMVTPEQLLSIENLVNDKIRSNIKAQIKTMPIEEAKRLGAMALFAEKYSQEVRVLFIDNFSIELCGGTHVNRTGDIGLFKIISEAGVAAGIRRIEFITGSYALERTQKYFSQIEAIAHQYKTDPGNILEKTTQILQDLKQKNKQLEALEANSAQQSSADLLNYVENLDGINVLIHRVDNKNSSDLRNLLDNLRTKLTQAIIILYAIDNNKINVVASMSKNLTDGKLNLLDLVKVLAQKGGGRPDMVQGGGDAPTDIEAKIAQIKMKIKDNLKV